MLKSIRLLKHSVKCFSTQSPSHVLEQLKNRSLIQIRGPEVSEYLQGLITNDIHHLENGPGSMFTMFLNTKGRVMYDAIVYRTQEDNSYIIECDREGQEALQRQLKMFRVRRKIDIENVDDKYTVYVLFNGTLNVNNKTEAKKDEELLVPCDSLILTLPKITAKMYKDLMIFKDPRITDLGSRIITAPDINIEAQIGELYDLGTADINYKQLRYALGVGEGVTDLPPNQNFPLESNCDYLHGVSFHKGCYVGQELTARTHHTGVTRKRLMPLQFIKTPTALLTDMSIINEGENLGKLRGIEGNTGLALLRIQKALNLEQFPVGDGLVKVNKPTWWPIEAAKERINVQKS